MSLMDAASLAAKEEFAPIMHRTDGCLNPRRHDAGNNDLGSCA
jgi:hypothetical protein